MSDGYLASEQHPTSARYAILCAEATSLWLFLTGPGAPDRIEADAFVRNRAPATEETSAPDGGPPPAPREVLVDPASCLPDPSARAWAFLWSPSGESVALLEDYEPVAMIHAGAGTSAELGQPCAWGAPWSDEAFAQVFFP